MLIELILPDKSNSNRQSTERLHIPDCIGAHSSAEKCSGHHRIEAVYRDERCSTNHSTFNCKTVQILESIDAGIPC